MTITVDTETFPWPTIIGVKEALEAQSEDYYKEAFDYELPEETRHHFLGYYNMCMRLKYAVERAERTRNFCSGTSWGDTEFDHDGLHIDITKGFIVNTPEDVSDAEFVLEDALGRVYRNPYIRIDRKQKPRPPAPYVPVFKWSLL